MIVVFVGITPTALSTFGRLLRPVVEHEYFVEVRLEDFYERQVGGVGKVDGTIRLAGKGDEEEVGESLIQFFRAVIDAPFIVTDLRNFTGQGGEGFFNGFDASRITVCLKGE